MSSPYGLMALIRRLLGGPAQQVPAGPGPMILPVTKVEPLPILVLTVGEGAALPSMLKPPAIVDKALSIDGKPDPLAIPKVPPLDRFDACLAVVLRHEGGYVDHPKDPGGATNMGITHATLAAWRGVPKVTPAQVKAMTRQEAASIYRSRYWAPLQCGSLPPGVDLMVFDFGVNSGVSRSVKALQNAVGVAADGQIGPKTLAAVNALPPAFLVTVLGEDRLTFLRSLPTWATFGKGWLRRVQETREAARAALG